MNKPFAIVSKLIRLKQSNPNNMRAIALLRSLLIQGKSLSEMTTLLNEQGFVTSKGCQFQIVQVKRLLVRAGLTF